MSLLGRLLGGLVGSLLGYRRSGSPPPPPRDPWDIDGALAPGRSVNAALRERSLVAELVVLRTLVSEDLAFDILAALAPGRGLAGGLATASVSSALSQRSVLSAIQSRAVTGVLATNAVEATLQSRVTQGETLPGTTVLGKL